MTIEDLEKWFDEIRRFSFRADVQGSLDFIESNSSVVVFSDHSHVLTDQIFYTATRVSLEKTYDVFFGSVPNRKSFEASFPMTDPRLTEMHSHNYIEMSLVLKGTMHLQFGNDVEDFNEGQICIVREGILHHDILDTEKETIILYIGISDRFFRSTFLTDQVSPATKKFLQHIIIGKSSDHDFVRLIPKSESSNVQKLYLDILTEMHDLTPGFMHLITGYCERILYLLSYEYQVALTQREHREYLYNVYKDVTAYIKNHSRNVTLRELSLVFGYTPDYFNRLIRRFSDHTYTELLQNARIQNAANLLATTDLSIEKVAEEVGYSNLGYFYKAFQNQFHETPAHYRRSHRQA